MNILPVTRNSAVELMTIPVRSGEIPTAQTTLEDVQVADFASWMDDHLNELEFRFQEYWTRESTLTALFQGRERR